MSNNITIRHCATLEEYGQCVSLQRQVWGWEDEDILPVRFFVVARKIEGQVIGAFEPSGQMVGFCLAVPALRGEEVYLHSHMLAVLPEFRRAGIGRRLKLEQRRDALARGIRLIEWTFDPLEWKNAVFNLNRLGAIARRYVPNQYGISSSPLHRGLPTDRLVAEWWLESPRVVACSEGKFAPPAPTVDRVTMPLDIADAPSEGPHRAAAVQAMLRQHLQSAFASGLAAVAFECAEQTGAYVLAVWP